MCTVRLMCSHPYCTCIVLLIAVPNLLECASSASRGNSPSRAAFKFKNFNVQAQICELCICVVSCTVYCARWFQSGWSIVRACARPGLRQQASMQRTASK